MRIFYTFLLSVGIVFFAGQAPARENKDLLKANYYYRHMAFYEAIPFFEKVADETNDPVVYSQLGNCYQLTNDLEKAAAAYAKAVTLKGCKDAMLLRYGQLLMQLMRYDEAAKWLKEYQLKNKNDIRAANLIAGCASAKNRFSQSISGGAYFLDFNTSGIDFAPTLWKGKLVFASDTAIDVKKKTDRLTGNAYMNLYSVACDASGHCSNELAKVGQERGLNIKYHDGPCTFSADGKQMYFTRSRYNDKFLTRGSISNKDSMVLLEIMIAHYDEKKNEFDEVIPFQYNSDKYTVAHPAINPNGKILVFSSNMPKGTGGCDLYMCRKAGKDKWSKPEHLDNVINTEGDEVFPYWADSTTLYFSSDGQEGMGGLDIYKTTWNDGGKTFTKPENIGTPINSSYDDISLALRADGGSSYFSSNRPAAKGGDNIYFYKREMLFLDLKVTDSITKEPLANVKVFLDAPQDKRDTATDNKGIYFAPITPATKYSIAVSKDGYDSKTLYLNTATNKEIDTLLRHVALSKAPLPVEPAPITPFTTSFTHLVGKPEVNTIYEIGHFYFAYDQSALSDTAKICLDSLVDFLNQNITMRIQVRAHTDCRGGTDYNLNLSNARANSVVKYLVEKGISAKRLEYKGFGMSMPHVKCECIKCTEDQHYQNRILEFKVLQL